MLVDLFSMVPGKPNAVNFPTGRSLCTVEITISNDEGVICIAKLLAKWV
jgi:hypothetical protein